MKKFDSTKLIRAYGSDIINSKYMDLQRRYIQHGNVSVFEHCLNVTHLSLCIAHVVPFKVDERSLVRGALLHDYFLYDWHIYDSSHKLHGFTHPKAALENASRDFILSQIERDIIIKHMFPLTINPPRYRETIIVSLADKICAILEFFSLRFNLGIK